MSNELQNTVARERQEMQNDTLTWVRREFQADLAKEYSELKRRLCGDLEGHMQRQRKEISQEVRERIDGEVEACLAKELQRMRLQEGRQDQGAMLQTVETRLQRLLQQESLRLVASMEALESRVDRQAQKVSNRADVLETALSRLRMEEACSEPATQVSSLGRSASDRVLLRGAAPPKKEVSWATHQLPQEPDAGDKAVDPDSARENRFRLDRYRSNQFHGI